MDQNETKNEEEITDVLVVLLKFYYKFKNKWKIVILFGVIGALIGGFIGFNKKPVYPTNSSIIIERSSSSRLSSYLSIAKSFGFGDNSSGGLLTPENFTEVGKSKRIVYSTLLSEVQINGKKDLLINHYIRLINPRIIENSKEKKDSFLIQCTEPFTGTLQEERAIRIIYNRIIKTDLQINTSAENSVIKINTTFSNERFTHLFAKKYLATIYDYFLNNIIHQENEMLALLRQKKDSIESILSLKQNRFADLNDRSINIVKTKMSLEKLELMKDIEIMNSLLATTIQSLEMTEFSAKESKKIFKIIDEPVLPIVPVKKGIIFYAFSFGLIFSIIKFSHMVIWLNFKKAKSKLSGLDSSK